jgi:hypothetical protein
VVALSPVRLEPAAGGSPRVLERGRTLWLDAGAARVYTNRDAATAELLVFAFKVVAATASPNP